MVVARRGTRIDRPAIAHRIAGSLARGHVLLQADPGSGKTVALEEALALSPSRAAWVRCVDEDRDPNRLMTDLVAAVGDARPDLGQLFGDWLATPDPVDPAGVVRAITRELERVLVERLVIVFDDAERLAGSEPAVAILRQLLHASGERLAVAIATRVDLGLRAGKLRASGRLDVLGVGDLAFTAADSAALLGEVTGESPGTDRVDAIMAATEGWPLGVALYAVAPAGAATARRTTAELFAYLAEEAVEDLDPETRRDLTVASIPRELDPAILSALDLPDGFADDIHRRGLFLRPIGHGGGRFVLHPLFRAFLLDRLPRELDADRVRALRRAVAPAVIASGDAAGGVNLLFEADAWDAAVAALADHGLGLSRSSPELVREWLERLPTSYSNEPVVLLLRGVLEMHRGRMAQCVAPLRAAQAEFRRRGDAPRDWLVRTLLVDGYWSIGDFERLVEQGRGFDAPDAKAAGPLRLIPALNAACGLATLGRWDESSALAAAAFAQPEGRALRPYDSARRAFGEIPNGTIEPVLAEMRASAEALAHDDPANLGPVYYAGVAQIEMEIGREDESFEAWRRAAEFAESYGMRPYIGLFARLYSALMHAEAGRIAEAEAELAVAGPIPDAGWRGHVVPAAQAILAMAKGDPREALPLVDLSLKIAAPAPTNERMWSAEWLVPVLASAGEHERAMAVLQDTLALVDERFPAPRGGFYRARLLILRAILREQAGDPDAADDLVACWAAAGDVIGHVLRRHRHRIAPLVDRAVEAGTLDWADAIDAIDRAEPGGEAVAAYLRHDAPAARAAAIAPAAASGNPAAAARIAELATDPDPNVRGAAAAALATLRESPPPLRISVLGGFRVRRGTWTVRERAWDRPMVARLVRLLLVHRGEAVPEDIIFEALWPGRRHEQARRSLQVAVSSARAVLDIPGATDSAIENRARTYRLRLRGGTVDAYEFEKAAVNALRAPPGDERHGLLELALGAWRGEPLPEDRYELWATQFRERLTDLYRGVLAALADEAVADPMAAITHVRRLVELDAVDEGARRRLMALYARVGRRGEALRAYLELRRALVDELGIEPAAVTNELHARILAGDSV